MGEQERIRVIDLAWEWVKAAGLAKKPTPEATVNAMAEIFDRAYKAIVKTVTS